MSAMVAAAAAAALAAADGPSRALPYDAIRDPVITGTAGAAWLLLHFFEERLASGGCRWCEPPAADVAARAALRWESSGGAATASDVLAYGAVPIVGLGVGFFVSGRDTKAAGVDALIATESVALAGLAGQAVKLAVARRRPAAYASGAARASSDDDASFYSGHASAAFALATSFATCSSLRGDGDAWVAWASGLPLAAFTGYLRIAADRHYLSDVLAGAGAGAVAGILVPRLLHSPAPVATPQQGAAARVPALTFGGRF
ncbi:MAG: phosphatase PAP2 family protein [Myxococcales bacterium]